MGWLAVVMMLVALSGCATASEVVNHSFGFDMRTDDQDAVVLDYRYGDSKLPTARNPEHRRIEGNSLQGTGITGEMRVGNSLYVKWQSKGSGEIYEETVDLRSRLPADIRNHEIYFMIRGKQLFVYLITPDRLPIGQTPIGPQAYQWHKAIVLYPDNASKVFRTWCRRRDLAGSSMQS